MKIRSQILATLGLVTLLPTAAVAFLSHDRTAEATLERADLELAAVAERAASKVDSHVAHKLTEVAGMADMPALRELLSGSAAATSDATQVLQNLAARNAASTIACGLLDRFGKCVLDTRESAIGSTEEPQTYFRTVLATGKPVAGKAEWVDVAWPLLVHAAAVRGRDNRVIGVLRTAVESREMMNIVAEAAENAASATVAIVDAEGRLLIDSGSPARNFGADRADLGAESPGRRVQEQSWFLPGARLRSDGFAALEPIGDTGWNVMAWQPRSLHEAPLARLSQRTLLEAMLLMAFLLIAACIAARIVARPVQRLERAAHAIADGQTDVTIPNGNSEIGSLGRTMQLMRDRLLAAMHDLQDSAVSARVASSVKSQFLANMSHELRTPLTAIIGYTELVSEDRELPRESRDTVATILRNARHLLDLVNEILDLAQVESGTMRVDLTEFDPAQTLQEVVELLQIKARDRQLELRVETDRLPATLRSDSRRLRQILLNLTGNALKFTTSGSVVVRARFRRSSSELVCEVEDTGCGIGREAMAELFRPFAQVDDSMSRQHGGTGLGLSISQHLAHLLGGEITCTSTLGEGSTFRLRIPAELVAPRVARKAAKQPIDRPTLAGRILLVEDGRDNQRLFSHILRKAGADVTIANDGLEGVKQFAIDGNPELGLREPPPFDLVIMDMQMPVLDGYQATRMLREMGLQLPIVALTAHAMGDAQTECLDAGCDHCATKPIQGKALVALCAEWLAKGATANWQAKAPVS